MKLPSFYLGTAAALVHGAIAVASDEVQEREACVFHFEIVRIREKRELTKKHTLISL